MSSTSIVASASKATINVFDTVANTANAATKLVNGLSTSANMFERMMNDMDENHRKRSLLNQAQYEETLLKEMSDKITQEDLQYQKKMEDNDYRELFKTTYSKLDTILNPPKTV